MDHHPWHHRWIVPARSRGVYSLEVRVLQATPTRPDAQRQPREEQRGKTVHQQVNQINRGHLWIKKLEKPPVKPTRLKVEN